MFLNLGDDPSSVVLILISLPWAKPRVVPCVLFNVWLPSLLTPMAMHWGLWFKVFVCNGCCYLRWCLIRFIQCLFLLSVSVCGFITISFCGGTSWLYVYGCGYHSGIVTRQIHHVGGAFPRFNVVGGCYGWCRNVVGRTLALHHVGGAFVRACPRTGAGFACPA